MIIPNQPQPLGGIKVIDLGLWIAGPAAAAIMADWGADVIKVEPKAGDPARNALASILGIENFKSPAFEADNRGKRSIVLDLTAAEGKTTLDQLLSEADVFISNMRPNALERLDLSPEQLREKYPHLVIAQVTGYGSSGPEIDRPGYDSGAFWAYSGLAHQFSGETGYPPILPAAFGDHITAITLVSGITTALFDRTRTGTGSIVETSLLKLGIYAATSDYSLQMAFKRPRPIQRRKDSESPLVNSYKAADDKCLWLLCVEASRHWPKLAEAIGHPSLCADERFCSTKARHENRAELISTLDIIFATKTREEWATILDANNIWWSPVNSLEEVLDSEQAKEINAFVPLPSDEEKPKRTVASPIDFNRVPTMPKSACPELGQDTDIILNELKGK